MTTWIEPTVDVKLEIAFDTDPLATTPTYTDVTAYLRRNDSIRISRGVTSEDTAIGPGFATFTLSNLDRRFDPDYSSGAYYPNVLPMRRVKLTVTKTSSVVVFTGFVMSWTNDWTVADGVSIVRCVDSMWWLANKPLAGSAYEAIVLASDPAAYYRLQSTSDADAMDMAGESSGVITEQIPAQIWLGAVGIYEGTATSVDIRRPRGASNAIFDCAMIADTAITSPPVAVELWARIDASAVRMGVEARDTSGNYLSVQFAGTDHTAFVLQYSNSSTTRSFFGLIDSVPLPSGVHHVAVWADTTNIYIAIDGIKKYTSALTASASPTSERSIVVQATADGASTTLSGLCSVAIHTTAPSIDDFLAHFAVGQSAYGDPGYKERGGARIGRVLDEIGWPAAQRSLDEGSFRHGVYLPDSQQAADYIRSVADVERGLFFCDRSGNLAYVDLSASVGGAATGKTFSDDGATGAIRYTDLRMAPASVDTIRNVVTVSYSDVGAITRRDSTSESTYGSSQLFIDGPTLALARDASSIAAWELAAKKDPSTRVESISIPWRLDVAADTTAAVDTCSAVDLGDIVTVEITPRGVGSQVVKTCQVIGIEHVIELEQAITTLYMRPAYSQSGWFTLGTSALDGADVLLP